MKVAFLGTGLIGAGMVQPLATEHAVTVWNRTRAKAEALVPLGVTVADDPASAVRGAERVHLALTADDAVDAVLAALRPGLGAGVPVIDHTTAAPDRVAARAARCAADGVAYLHAPVFMSPQSCRDRTGLIVVAGPEPVFVRAEPWLARMTGRVWYVGARPDLAAAHKLFGNGVMIAIAGALADTMTMATALGLPADAPLALFQHFDPTGAIKVRGPRMAAGSFQPASFEASTALKDVRLMVDAAGDRPLAVLPGVAARLEALVARGHGADDLAVLAVDVEDPHT